MMMLPNILDMWRSPISIPPAFLMVREMLECAMNAGAQATGLDRS
jgi:hypothetical protein